MSSKLPITHLLPALLAVAVVSNLGGAILADGEVTPGDLKHVLAAFPELPILAEVKPGAALAEALDVDETEKAEIHKAFKAKFNIPDDAKEAAVEDLVDAALHGLVGFAKAKLAFAVLFPPAEPAEVV